MSTNVLTSKDSPVSLFRGKVIYDYSMDETVPTYLLFYFHQGLSNFKFDNVSPILFSDSIYLVVVVVNFFLGRSRA